MGSFVLFFLLFASLLVPSRVFAQEPPPRIGPYAVDFHLSVPRFGDDPYVAASRGLAVAELPGTGLGVSAGAHVYLPRTGVVTFGIGGEVLIGSSHFETPPPIVTTVGTTTTTTVSKLRSVTQTFKTISPQISMNFGNGHGWSYLSGGIGRSVWSIVLDNGTPLPVDDEVLGTINYGGGARWFAKKHLAFSLDVRMYRIDASTAESLYPPSPQTLLLIISGGISVK